MGKNLHVTGEKLNVNGEILICGEEFTLKRKTIIKIT